MKENKSDFIKKLMEMQKQIKGEKEIQLLEIENKPLETGRYEKIAQNTI